MDRAGSCSGLSRSPSRLRFIRTDGGETIPLVPVPTRLWGLWAARSSTCCNVEPVATLPSCFLSSSSSCMEILEAAAGALRLVALLAAALASSALSFAFCCKYCRV